MNVTPETLALVALAALAGSAVGAYLRGFVGAAIADRKPKRPVNAYLVGIHLNGNSSAGMDIELEWMGEGSKLIIKETIGFSRGQDDFSDAAARLYRAIWEDGRPVRRMFPR